MRFRWTYANLSKWHRWFAWYPVKVTRGECAWMEYVERRIERVYLKRGRIVPEDEGTYWDLIEWYRPVGSKDERGV